MISIYPFSSLFISTLGLSTFIALSRNNWIIIWARIELNLLSIIPLITLSSINQETEAAIKYFFAQAIGSASFLAAVIFNLSSGLYFLAPNETPLILFFFGILIKAGAAPCHFWLPNVISGLRWNLCLLLTTWQKIIPIWIFIHLSSSINSFIIILVGILGALVGGLGGINQSQLRAILAYSSINHSGWILACSTISTSFRLIYFLIYILSLAPIIVTLSLLFIKSVPQTNTFSSLPLTNKIWLIALFLSLGGLPPLFGFIPKFIALIIIINNQFIIIPLILILGSLLSLYYYLTIFFNISLATRQNNANNYTHNTFNISYIILLLSSLTFAPFILSLFYALIIFHQSQRHWNYIFSIWCLSRPSRNNNKPLNSYWARTTRYFYW